MPTYQYRCLDCALNHEVVQKFSDAALTDCPDCNGQLRKVFSPVGVVFKGSGFYATDSRSKKSTTVSTPKDKPGSSSAKSSEKSSSPASSASTGGSSAA